MRQTRTLSESIFLIVYSYPYLRLTTQAIDDTELRLPIGIKKLSPTPIRRSDERGGMLDGIGTSFSIS